MKMKNLSYLENILESIDKINNYTSGLSYDDFVENNLVIDAVVRNLGVVGEASKHLPAEFQHQYNDVPWLSLVGLNSILNHDYFGIDKAIIWHISTTDFKVISPVMKQILDELRLSETRGKIQ